MYRDASFGETDESIRHGYDTTLVGCGILLRQHSIVIFKGLNVSSWTYSTLEGEDSIFLEVLGSVCNYALMHHHIPEERV